MKNRGSKFRFFQKTFTKASYVALPYETQNTKDGLDMNFSIKSSPSTGNK